MGNDFSLYNHHKKRYLGFGRWILGVSVMGFLLNYFWFIQEVWVNLAFAIVTVAIPLNSIKEKLPQAKAAFPGGVIFYIALLYLIK